jgi:hypothetical protein
MAILPLKTVIKKIRLFNKNEGQSLIEVVFGILMAFLLLSGLAAAVVFMLSAVQFSRNKAKATQIAKAVIEDIKYQKQDSGFSWTDSLGNDCESKINPADQGIFDCDYDVEVTPDPCLDKCSMGLTVNVSWGSTKGDVTIKTVLTNWEQ